MFLIPVLFPLLCILILNSKLLRMILQIGMTRRVLFASRTGEM